MKTKTDINIQLIPVGQPVGPLKWNMSMNGGKASGPKSYPVAEVPYNTEGQLTFTIQHPGPIVFDSFCAQLGNTKPPTACDNQFSATGQGTTTMVVNDTNVTAGDYTYVISFKNAPSLDPIIKNGGGGGRSIDMVTYALVGALVGALVSILFVRIVLNWRRADRA